MWWNIGDWSRLRDPLPLDGLCQLFSISWFEEPCFFGQPGFMQSYILHVYPENRVQDGGSKLLLTIYRTQCGRNYSQK